MGRAQAKFVVYFIGQPDEFRRAHKMELADIGAEAFWVDRVESIPSKANPGILVLNLDQSGKSDPQSWEAVRTRFPQSDLIALSSRDSAQLAMRCLRDGFSDFLTQPVAPDELALSLLRSRQRRESEAKTLSLGDISRSLTQISSCTSTATLRLRTLAALQALLGGAHAIWSDKKIKKSRSPRRHVFLMKDGKRKVVLSCRRETNGRFVISSIAGRPTKNKLEQASALVEHAELVLMNLRRVEKLKRQTFVDDLTGLYNSRYLRFGLEAAAVQFQQKKEPFALIFIDVDRFKSVNDRHGHLVGSEFLGALGRIIKYAVRTGDLVFRYGGDEFVVLLRNTGVGRGLEIAERLRTQIEKRSFTIRNISIRSTVSMGLAVYPEHAGTTDNLIQCADDAMYEAKKKRNSVKVAAASKSAPARSRRQPQPLL